MTTNRIVVLGASGFIGRRVVRELARGGWARPVAVSRHASKARMGNVECHDIDVSDAGQLRRVLQDCSGVVSCIAGSPDIIVSSAESLFAVARDMQARPRIVQVSSMAAYGSVAGIVNEKSPLLGDLDGYSAAKARTDEMAAAYENAAILRPGIVYGPRSSWWSDRVARLLMRGRLGNLGAVGDGYCNLVYVDDVAVAVRQAFQLPRSELGAFNLSMTVPPTWNEYFELYGAALSAPPVKVSKARLAIETRILAPPLKVLESLLQETHLARWNPVPPLRGWLPELCSRNIRLDVTRAEVGLGMRWTPLMMGLRATADWFIAGGRTAK